MKANCATTIACNFIQCNGYTVEVIREGGETVIPGTSMLSRSSSVVWTGRALIEPVEGIERELYGGQQSNTEKNRRIKIERKYRIYFCADDIEISEEDDIIQVGADRYKVLYVDPVYFKDSIPLYTATCIREENA